jgi:hypothetical protein
MTVSQQIIDILNNDPKARRMKQLFENAADKANMHGEERQKAWETTLMLIMSKNKQVMELMANEIYEEVNGIEN